MMTIEEAQGIADAAIIAGLEGNLDRLRGTSGLRQRLLQRIIGVGAEVDGKADKIIASLGNALTSTQLSVPAVRSALTSSLGD